MAVTEDGEELGGDVGEGSEGLDEQEDGVDAVFQAERDGHVQRVFGDGALWWLKCVEVSSRDVRCPGGHGVCRVASTGTGFGGGGVLPYHVDDDQHLSM